jgi:hypothetical protein
MLDRLRGERKFELRLWKISQMATRPMTTGSALRSPGRSLRQNASADALIHPGRSGAPEAVRRSVDAASSGDRVCV